MWIHEHQNWTDFTWDGDALASKLADIHRRQGRLLGRMDALGFELTSEASLSALTSDVVKSSAIEGEQLDPEAVRSSIASRLGIDIGGIHKDSRDVEGIVEMMLDATQRFSAPLTKERLFGWHAALFPTGWSVRGDKITVGAWRKGSMRVASGPMGKERIHFIAPSAERLDNEMGLFLEWFENGSELDPILKAGVAHFWFVTIHPFADGNGRIARAIGDMALARADKTPHRFYSLSSQIAAERKVYYDRLEQRQRGKPEITDWLEWFLDCLRRAFANAETTVGNVLFKAQLWEIVNQKPVNERQRLIINRMLEDDFKGHMNTSKYAKMAKCSSDTALRDIQDLRDREIFVQNPGGGRSTSYSLPTRA